MVEGRSVKGSVRLTMPVHVKVSPQKWHCAVSSISIARAGHRAGPYANGAGQDTLPS